MVQSDLVTYMGVTVVILFLQATNSVLKLNVWVSLKRSTIKETQAFRVSNPTLHTLLCHLIFELRPQIYDI